MTVDTNETPSGDDPTASRGLLAGTEAPARLRGEVLAAVDGRPESDGALAVAALLAHRDGVPLRLASVLDESGSRAAGLARTVLPAYLERWRADHRYERVHAQALRVLGDSASPIRPGSGPPGSDIADEIHTHGAALVVIGLGSQTPYARLFGDETALAMVRAAAVPVLAVVPTQRTLPMRALVAVDFSPASIAAVAATLRVVADGATVHLCHVAADPDVFPVEPALWRTVYATGARVTLNELRERLGAPGTVTVATHVLDGEARRALLDFAAAHDVDLIACGTRRLGLLARLTEGSVAGGLLLHAGRSVLVAPAPPDDPVRE